MAVCSGGGHWSQMQLISKAFPPSNVVYITTHINRAAKNINNAIHFVPDADMSNKLGLIKLAFCVMVQVIRHRPDVIISTGAAPGFFAILFGRLTRSKTIWIDSIANYQKPSLSGAKIKKHCDLYLSQWPHHATESNVNYWGHLI